MQIHWERHKSQWLLSVIVGVGHSQSLERLLERFKVVATLLVVIEFKPQPDSTNLDVEIAEFSIVISVLVRFKLLMDFVSHLLLSLFDILVLGISLSFARRYWLLPLLFGIGVGQNRKLA